MSTAKLIERLTEILPGIQNSNSAAEVAMVEALPEVIARLGVTARALEEISENCPASEWDEDGPPTWGESGHNADDHASAHADYHSAKIGNVARKALESSK